MCLYMQPGKHTFFKQRQMQIKVDIHSYFPKTCNFGNSIPKENKRFRQTGQQKLHVLFYFFFWSYPLKFPIGIACKKCFSIVENHVKT